MGLPYCKLPDIICPICKRQFTPNSGNQVYCKTCRETRNGEIQARLRKIRADEGPLAVRKKRGKAKSIKQIISDLEQYNKQHRTMLTYGKYVSLLEQGVIKD